MTSSILYTTFFYREGDGDGNQRIRDKCVKAIPKFELRVSKPISWVEKRWE